MFSASIQRKDMIYFFLFVFPKDRERRGGIARFGGKREREREREG